MTDIQPHKTLLRPATILLGLAVGIPSPFFAVGCTPAPSQCPCAVTAPETPRPESSPVDTEDDPVPAKNGFVAADWADVFRQVAEEMWLEDDEMSVDAERARAELCGSCEGPGPWPIHLVHGSDEQVRIVRPTGVGRLLVSPPILEVTNECFGRDSPELEVMGPWASDSEVVIFIAYQETVKQFVDELPDDEREEIGELDWFCTGDSIRCFVTLDPLTLAPTHEDCSLLESGMEILPSVPRLAASLVRLIR